MKLFGYYLPYIGFTNVVYDTKTSMCFWFSEPQLGSKEALVMAWLGHTLVIEFE